jgi:hypothetical protein
VNTTQQNNDELKVEVSFGGAEIKSAETKIVANDITERSSLVSISFWVRSRWKNSVLD